MNGIKLIESILKDMEYIGLLLSDRKYVSPLNTFNLVIGKLNKLKVMLDTEYLTPDQIREAVRRLEKPISGDPPSDITVGDDLTMPLSGTPFSCDGVGGEQVKLR